MKMTHHGEGFCIQVANHARIVAEKDSTIAAYREQVHKLVSDQAETLERLRNAEETIARLTTPVSDEEETRFDLCGSSLRAANALIAARAEKKGEQACLHPLP